MNPAVIIPTFHTAPTKRGASKPSNLYDHPTPLNVGAGPSGLEAARNLKLRGFKNVTVVDQKKKACGLLNLAQVLNEELPPMVDWYNNEIKRLGLDVRLNTKADANYIKDFGADEVILAVGPETSSPDVPGKNRKNVIDHGIFFASI